MRKRFLRPAHIIFDGTAAWLVDEFQPVAGVLDSAGGRPAIIDFRDNRIPPAAPESTRRVRAARSGIVLQDGVGGAVSWISTNGDAAAQPGPGLRLCSVSGDTAWLIRHAVLDAGTPGPDGSPPVPPPLPEGLIVGVEPDGSHKQLRTDHPIRDVAPENGGLRVHFSERPIVHAHGRNTWGFEYPSTTVLIGAEELSAHSRDQTALRLREHPLVDTRFRPLTSRAWLDSDPVSVRRYGFPATGLLWSAGAPKDGDIIHRHAVLTGHDPDSGAEIHRIDLGIGQVLDLGEVGDRLWVAVARRRHLADSRDRGIEVLAVTPAGHPQTVLAPDSIDITGRGWAPVRPPETEIREHLQRQRELFTALTGFWKSADGTAAPLSAGLTDPATVLTGNWPDTRLELTFTHPARGSVRLRRTLQLFDELGRPQPNDYAAIHLMEDLDTGHIAPVEEAIDGILDT